MIWYALPLCTMLLQVNRLLLEKFPMPSVPLLDENQQGGFDTLKALKIVHEKDSFSCDCILIIDEMYFAKICTVSIRRECKSRQGRKFIERNCCVYGSWI